MTILLLAHSAIIDTTRKSLISIRIRIRKNVYKLFMFVCLYGDGIGPVVVHVRVFSNHFEILFTTYTVI